MEKRFSVRLSIVECDDDGVKCGAEFGIHSVARISSKLIEELGAPEAMRQTLVCAMALVTHKNEMQSDLIDKTIAEHLGEIDGTR